VAALTYAELRGIQFRGEAALWRGDAPFELQLFHPGGGFTNPVRIHLMEDGRTHRLDFDPALFRYGDEVEGRDLSLPPEAGYPGFRILFPMNDSGRMDEVASFLGASYFRLVGPHQVYGVSSRGLAVNVADPLGEEFPDFVEFWIEKPARGDTTLVFYGLLDGPSVSGAYRFRLTPGAGDAETGRGTVLEVEARLFAREEVRRLGVAPLTSMYLHGTFRPGGDDDFRPRVHDSEGLLMETGREEWIWRPLTNGEALRVTSLRDADPRGFGLVQRDRDFGSYLDLEARYHLRPSQWVATEGEWGGGGVELVEFTTVSEFSDNIVAYWSPDGAFGRGEERLFRYRLVTFGHRLEGGSYPGGPLDGEALARVVRTRIGWDGLPGQAAPPPRSRRRVVVDFSGGDLAARVPRDSVEAVLTTTAGDVSEALVLPLPDGGLRATFSLWVPEDRGADMRLFLRSGDRILTETWSYLQEPVRGR
jgi:glucans biosynthesis protein